MRGPAGYLTIIGMMRGGFPDIQWTLEEMIAEGNKSVWSWFCQVDDSLNRVIQ